MSDNSHLSTEYEEYFNSCDSWLSWFEQHKGALTNDVPHAIAEMSQRGVVSLFLGACGPEDMAVNGTNYREELCAKGLNSRCRAVLDLLVSDPVGRDFAGARIFAPEAVTRFAETLDEKYEHFVGSEFDPTGKLAVRHEDLMNLSFAKDSFDIAICNEVFEHVPDLDKTLNELQRILRPAGLLLATFPFAYNEDKTIVQARMQRGEIKYFCEPEYHGNPVDAKGSLVFQVPAWDILEQCGNAGFANAEMIFVSSASRGIIGAEIAGVHILKARV